LTIAQAVEHSPAQLKLLMRAVSRSKAADGLLLVDIVQSGVAACMVKDGARAARELKTQLRKVIDG